MFNKTQGEKFAIELIDKDNDIYLQISIKYNDQWINQGLPFSGYWLEDLITELHIAQLLLFEKQPIIIEKEEND